MLRVVQRAGQRAFQGADAAFNRVFGERSNPLYHLGPLSYWLFWLVLGSGLYLYAFYDTGVDDAYRSVERLGTDQRYAGGVLRSVHRYASDALVLTMLLHLVRHFVFDRYRAFRAFAWVSGVALLWLVYASGINGFMLPWDRLAQYVATATAEWLDALPVFGGTLVRNFVLAENLNDRLFSLLSFLHIGIPLTMLAVSWVHVQRVPQVRMLPPRPLMIGTGLAMLALALLRPIASQGPAELARVPLSLSFDWFYLFLYPLLLAWSPYAVWALVGGASLLLLLLPWLSPRRHGADGTTRAIFYPMARAVTPREGESLLDAGLRAGLELPFECRSGGCGVCKARVLGGKVAHGAVQPSALSAAERAAGALLLCQATALGEVAIELDTDASARDTVPRFTARVERIEHLAPDVLGVTLRLEGGARVEFLAGQHLNVILADGARRSYSFTTASDSTDRIELHIRRIPGGRFTGWAFERMRVGDALTLEGPLGDFVLRETSERPILFVAGATGFAPVKSLLEEAFRLGLLRPMHFYWGVRAKRDLYMADLPERWAREHPNFRFVPVLSAPDPEDRWSGRTGLVHETMLEDFPDLSGHEVYACGSIRMVEAARPAFIAHGLAGTACFSDAFTRVPEAREPSPG